MLMYMRGYKLLLARLFDSRSFGSQIPHNRRRSRSHSPSV
jgi:hypothetical protein